MAQLIIGVGNRFRGDDAAGPLVGEALAARGFEVEEHAGEGASLMELWRGRSHVVLIDATRSGAAPGTIIRFDAALQSVPTGIFHYSTHEFSVAEAIETARLLDWLPNSLRVFGIEGAAWDYGAPVSAPVAAAVERLANEIADLLAADTGPR
ncbi:hydrogenase maturation protease [Consotaella salsifontis]|uniref:hydrogenase maturation protease n=1 Tax=Consotaella salsifontis TaxID=1365950 RepID=UPI0013F61E67|nr:hydrogenase maturation protease [Consotaella salsifontis]